MLADTLIVESGPGEVRGAVLALGRVWEVDHFRTAAPNCFGAVYRARIAHVDRGLNAAFVELGDGWTRHGFLRARDAGPGSQGSKSARIQQIVQEGATIIVQIVGGNPTRTPNVGDRLVAERVKGPSVSAGVTFKARNFDYLPNRRELGLLDIRGGNLTPVATSVVDERLRGRLADLLQAGEGLRLTPDFATSAADADAEPLIAELTEDLAAVRRRWHEAKDRAAALAAPGCIVEAPGPIAQILDEYAHQGLARIVVSAPSDLKAARDWAATRMPDLVARIELGPTGGSPFADHEIDADIESALSPRAEFGRGGVLLFEPGETLTAIDVNSGGQSGKAGRQPLDVNMDAVPEIARQIRLRALAGPIVVDFLKMSRAADRDAVAASFVQNMAGDPAQCHVAGFSPLGHLELTRQRRKPTLAERLEAPASPRGPSAEAACYAALRRASTLGAPVAGLTVSVAMAELLTGPLAAAVEEAGRRVGRPLRIDTDVGLRASDYHLVED